MIDLFYRKPRILILFLVLVVVSGLGAVQVLPRAEDPELTGRNAAIFAAFPGASAERVEALVTEPIEDLLGEIEEIKDLITSSSAGLAVLQVELLESVPNVDQVWSRVRDKLGDVQRDLPAGALPPELEEFEIAAYTLLFGLTWDLETPVQHAILSRIGDDLADRMRALGGTQEAKVFGQVTEEVQVSVDSARLAAHGLSIDDVARATIAADSKVPAGTLVGTNEELLLEVDGELDSPGRIASLPVRVDARGRTVRVGDLGTVTKQARSPRETLTLVSGNPGIVVAVRMESGRRVDLWTQSAREAFDEFTSSLPRGVQPSILFEQSEYTEERLGSLLRNFGMGAGLVLLVILFMMGWRSALLVGITLPLTSLMVLQGMRILGMPIHQMSVTGLIIALGLLIDNAIVMVDEVRHRLSSGLPPRKAVEAAVRGLGIPLIGSTATTVFAFLPIVLMPGNAGEFVGPIAVSVVLAITSSLFLALTVTPALTARFSRVAPEGKRPMFGLGALSQGIQSRTLTAAYRRFLRTLMAWPIVPLLLAGVLPILGIWKGSQLPEQFFPPADRDQFAVELILPQAASIDQTRAAVDQAGQTLRRHSRVRDVHWFLGTSAPKFYYNFTETKRDAAYYAQGFVQLDGPEESLAVVREIQDRLSADLPGVQVLAKQIEQGPPFEAPVELYVFGSDLDELRRIGEDLRALLGGLADVTATKSLLSSGRPKLRLALDEESTRLAGWDNRSVAQSLFGALEGVPGGTLLEATEELPVVVRLKEDQRTDLGSLSTLRLQRGDSVLPLNALGQLRLEPEIAEIPHRDGLRCNTVQAFLQAGALPAETLEAALATMEEQNFEVPPSYRIAIGGESAERDEAVGNLASTAAILLVAMGASLVLAFSSFRLAAVVAAVGILSVGLSLGSLWLFGYPFGFMAIVGTMGLIGVAINDSIVVLAALEEDDAACAGSKRAVVEVVIRSTRHVLATTFTTAAGFFPLWLAGGGFWPPLAVAIGFGVLGATLLALTFVPAAFLLVRAQRVTRRPEERGSPQPAPAL